MAMRPPTYSFLLSALLFCVVSGCATVRTTVPPEKYDELRWPADYRITSRDGEVRKTNYVKSDDSTLTIVAPTNPAWDRRQYPVTLRYSEIDSIEREQTISVLYLEAGAIYGKNFGVESNVHSDWRAVFELGYMSGERSDFSKPRWDLGGTAYLAAADTDSRIGLRARARYRAHRNISFGISAGPLFGWWDGSFFNGFVGGGSVNFGSWFALRSEYMAYNAPPWLEDVGETFVEHPGGYEQVWYNGAVLSGTPAWFTVGVGAGAFVALIILFMINPPEFPTS